MLEGHTARVGEEPPGGKGGGVLWGQATSSAYPPPGHRGTGLERRPALIREPGPHDPAEGHPHAPPAVRAAAAGPPARGVRAQVVHRPPAPRLGGQRQQGRPTPHSLQPPVWSRGNGGVPRDASLTAPFLQLLVWNHSSLSPVQQYTEHLAAVKAIAWSPHQHGLLASGGGTADRCIRFWNTLTGQPLQCIDTGSQVCNLAWSKHANELVSVGVQDGWAAGGQAVRPRPARSGRTSRCPHSVTPREAQGLSWAMWSPCQSSRGPGSQAGGCHLLVFAPFRQALCSYACGCIWGPGTPAQCPFCPLGEHTRLLTEPDPGLEVSLSDPGGQADRALLSGPVPGESPFQAQEAVRPAAQVCHPIWASSGPRAQVTGCGIVTLSLFHQLPAL